MSSKNPNRYLALADRLDDVPFIMPHSEMMAEAAEAMRTRDDDYQTVLEAHVEQTARLTAAEARAEAAEAEVAQQRGRRFARRAEVERLIIDVLDGIMPPTSLDERQTARHALDRLAALALEDDHG